MKVVHLYGLPCSGKTTIGQELAKHLNAIVLDGDDVRSGLNSDLGFTKKDRIENLRRLGALSSLLNKQGFNVIICTVAPHIECRTIVEKHVDDYVSVFVDTPLEICIERDTKGMYGEAINDKRKNFTGVQGKFEIGDPNLIVAPDSLENQVDYILCNLVGRNGKFWSLDEKGRFLMVMKPRLMW